MALRIDACGLYIADALNVFVVYMANCICTTNRCIVIMLWELRTQITSLHVTFLLCDCVTVCHCLRLSLKVVLLVEDVCFLSLHAVVCSVAGGASTAREEQHGAIDVT